MLTAQRQSGAVAWNLHGSEAFSERNSVTDIFNKAVQTNTPKTLRNLCTQFDVNTENL